MESSSNETKSQEFYVSKSEILTRSLMEIHQLDMLGMQNHAMFYLSKFADS